MVTEQLASIDHHKGQPMTESTDRREVLCAWLTANGIDPNRVPLDADMTITIADHGARWLWCEVYARDDAGHLVANVQGDAATRTTVTVPLITEPPEWWTPHVKPTREQLLEAIAAVGKLHVRNANSGTCEHCSERDYPDYGVQWPCPTMNAIGGVRPVVNP